MSSWPRSEQVLDECEYLVTGSFLLSQLDEMSVLEHISERLLGFNT